ncbi:MAG: response regulator [Candidatus Melainabacteria bacterium]|nr:response regulator [Candidatus Melainabacteria bacterium]
MSKDILLVEDTLTQAMLFQHLLEKNGQSVKLARSGAKALELLEKLHHLNELPALILTDINMPEMNGYELCRALKANSAYAHIQVVLFASATSPDEIAEILNCGADNVVLKKWDEQKLVKKLKLLVEDGATQNGNSSALCDIQARINGKDIDVSFEPVRALAIMASLYEFLCTD